MPQSLHDKIAEIIDESDTDSRDGRIRKLVWCVAMAIADHVEGERLDPSVIVNTSAPTIASDGTDQWTVYAQIPQAAD